MEVELQHTFGPKEVQTFAHLSGDDNPIHLDHDYATKQVYIETHESSCTHVNV